MAQETTSCGLCNVETSNTGTGLCDRCWELDRRIKSDPVIAARILAEVCPARAWVASHDAGHLIYVSTTNEDLNQVGAKFPEYHVHELRKAETPNAFYFQISITSDLRIT